MTACPDEAKISDFVSRTLATVAAAQIEAHLADCDDCRDLVFALASSADDAAEPSTVERAGRFELRDVIGRGAMGVVYRAHDPELDRMVAVKLRQRRATLDHDADDRLRREAQALARLAHGNVVTVYETGRQGDATYVAMELVDGVTLDDWLKTPRSQRQILDVMLGAGRGLAAAHAVGLIHRDFKPRNVIVSAAGVAKVGDFGLVRARAEAGDTTTPPSELELTLSVSGALIGTPAYMAPEQLRGELATEASDQFSYCVTLYEALCGARPFAPASTTLAELVAAMQRGVTFPSRLPRHVRRVLERGLAIDPARRFPSMAALLAVLGRRRDARVWIAAAATTVALAATGVAWSMRDHTEPCSGVERELAGIWDDARRQAMTAAFHATNLAYADDVATKTRALLDRRAGAWIAAQRDACEAVHVREVQTEAMLELRTSCLAERRAELRAVTDLLVRADADAVPHAIDAVTALEGLEQCADLPALQQVVRPPADVVRRGQVEVQRAELARARALLGLARADQAVARVQPLVDATRALGYAPLHADALTAYGEALHDVGRDQDATRVLREAIAAADRGGDDRARIEAWDRLIIVLFYTRRLTELADALQQAHAVLERIPYDAELHQRFALRDAMALVACGKAAEAIPKYRALIAEHERAGRPEDAALAEIYTMLGDALARTDHQAEGGEMLQKAQQILSHVYGASRTDSIEARSNELQANIFQAMLLLDQKKPAEALALVEPAAAQLAQLHGPDHESVGMAQHVLGMTYHALGRDDEARAAHERALAIHRVVHGDDHMKIAASYMELGILEYDAHNYDLAAGWFDRAYPIFAKSRGADSMQAAAMDLWAARCLIAAGQLDAAAARVARTRALPNEFGKSPAVLALDGEILIARGLSLSGGAAGPDAGASGRTAQGMAMLERAFAIPSKGDWIGHAQLVMARALDRSGRRRDAIAYAERSVATLTKRGERAQAAEAREYLASLQK
ncbi:MAG TPA: protein kinase [Kofleriaceae bacterium]|nr:protein kinase [Kofleriaceae bacterium]